MSVTEITPNAPEIVTVTVYDINDLPNGDMNVKDVYDVDFRDRDVISWLRRTMVWAINNKHGVQIEKCTLPASEVSLFRPAPPQQNNQRRRTGSSSSNYNDRTPRVAARG